MGVFTGSSGEMLKEMAMNINPGKQSSAKPHHLVLISVLVGFALLAYCLDSVFLGHIQNGLILIGLALVFRVGHFSHFSRKSTKKSDLYVVHRKKAK